MNKHSTKNRVVRLWNRFMESDILPIIWGTITVTAITAALLSIGIVAIRWLLTLVGVIV